MGEMARLQLLSNTTCIINPINTRAMGRRSIDERPMARNEIHSEGCVPRLRSTYEVFRPATCQFEKPVSQIHSAHEHEMRRTSVLKGMQGQVSQLRLCRAR